MALTGEASTGRGAVAIARGGKVDVLLLDLMMPRTGGMDVLPMIRAKAPQMGVILFTHYPPQHCALAALRLGARGYLNKQCDPSEILRAVRTVAGDRQYLSPDVAELLASNLAGHASRHLHEGLTRRELQLLVHFATGSASAKIALLLSLSPKTVSTYRGAILKKLELRTNSDMTHYAMVHGLID